MRIRDEHTSQVTLDARAGGCVYFRRADRLSRRDRADLEAYAEVLRPYYGIPDGQPVFPKPKRVRPLPTSTRPKLDRKPRPKGTNSERHPWRGTL